MFRKIETYRLRKIIKQSTKVVGWYLHRYDRITGGAATIRGPWHRWITIQEGTDPDCRHVAPVQNDAEFVHEAMVNFEPLVNEVETLYHNLDKALKLLEDMSGHIRDEGEEYSYCDRVTAFKENLGIKPRTENQFKFVTPTVPNFVSIDLRVVGTRQQGFQPRPTLPLGDLTDSQIEDLVEAWRDDLFAVAERQRNIKGK